MSRALGKALAPQPTQAIQRSYGVVTAIVGEQLVVELSASGVDIGPLDRLASYRSPAVGDTVAIDHHGKTMLVVGRQGASAAIGAADIAPQAVTTAALGQGVVTAANIDPIVNNNINSKAPLGHTHVESDVNNLTADLANVGNTATSAFNTANSNLTRLNNDEANNGANFNNLYTRMAAAEQNMRDHGWTV